MLLYTILMNIFYRINFLRKISISKKIYFQRFKKNAYIGNFHDIYPKKCSFNSIFHINFFLLGILSIFLCRKCSPNFLFM